MNLFIPIKNLQELININYVLQLMLIFTINIVYYFVIIQ